MQTKHDFRGVSFYLLENVAENDIVLTNRRELLRFYQQRRPEPAVYGRNVVTEENSMEIVRALHEEYERVWIVPIQYGYRPLDPVIEHYDLVPVARFRELNVFMIP